MTRHYCDRCGEQHSGTGLRRLRVSITGLNEDGAEAGSLRRSHYDLCDDCLHDVTLRLDDALVAAPAAAEKGGAS